MDIRWRERVTRVPGADAVHDLRSFIHSFHRLVHPLPRTPPPPFYRRLFLKNEG